MKYLLIILLSITSASAETRLLIPLYTDHIQTKDKRDYNEKNYGVGIEFALDQLTISAMYLDKNSFYNRSIYASISKEFEVIKNIAVSYGIAGASGYENLSDNGVIMFPVFSIKYKSFRIVTSFPSSTLFHPADLAPADFINFQYVYTFNP